MNHINKALAVLVLLVGSLAAMAQDKIEYPDISYAGAPRDLTLGGISVSGVSEYEDYMLIPI